MVFRIRLFILCVLFSSSVLFLSVYFVHNNFYFLKNGIFSHSRKAYHGDSVKGNFPWIPLAKWNEISTHLFSKVERGEVLHYPNGTEPSRELPNALLIGVKKGGTRALIEFIRLHPDVKAAGSEVHFFDRHYSRGYNWYRQNMPVTLEGQISMEKTPSYFVSKDVPQKVYQMNPSMKILLVLRDPVTRAISDYTQVVSKNATMPKFEDLAFQNGSHFGLVDTSWAPIKIGVYVRHLERWLQYFPLKQFHFVSGERLILDPATEITGVQDFLGLKRFITEKNFYFNSTKGFPCLLKSEGHSTPHCLGKTKGRSHPQIESAAMERLREFYRPFNLRLYQITGIDFGWP